MSMPNPNKNISFKIETISDKNKQAKMSLIPSCPCVGCSFFNLKTNGNLNTFKQVFEILQHRRALDLSHKSVGLVKQEACSKIGVISCFHTN